MPKKSKKELRREKAYQVICGELYQLLDDGVSPRDLAETLCSEIESYSGEIVEVL